MFGRRKKKEDSADSEERSIKLKESKENIQRKRESKKKPWGKKERFFVLFFVVGTTVLSFALAFVARKGKLPGLPSVNAPGLGLSETVVLTKSQVPEEWRTRDNSIIAKFSETTAELSGIYALSVIDLGSGDTYGVNQFGLMQAASLMKLPVMTLLLKNADIGKINLETVYTLKNSDKIGGSGSLYGSPEGTQLTYKKLLEYMGKQSDNTAFNVVRKKLGDAEIAAFLKDIGMTHTDLDTNMTSPADISLLLRKVYEGTLLSGQSKELLFDALTDTIYEQHLKAGVPEDVRVAHKYGRDVHVVNDAGIVFLKKPYVIVLMTDGVVEKEADSIFPTLSKIVFDGHSSGSGSR